ncbi:MAG: putative membrane protein, partial [Bermanella sp.]
MKNNWPVVDVLRGVAVIFMLLNHAAVKWIEVDEVNVGLAGTLNFIGSFAPVMFFFITGIGYGLAHQIGKPAKTKDVMVKAGILIVADLFMRGGDFTSFGWDFLAFIGFSMLLLHCLRGRRFGMLSAFMLIGVFLVTRFLLGPLYEARIEQPDYAMQALLGMRGLNGISYWFTPWFIYPLAGFILGHWASNFTATITKNPINVFLFFTISGASIAVVSFILESKGMSLFRWS